MTARELREATGMTQKEFAEYVGTTIYTIQKWEYADTCPEYVRKLLEYKLRNERLI